MPKIYYGKFHLEHIGFWEHYWMGYEWDRQEYFIDLTLKQFDKNAPKLAITKAKNSEKIGCYSHISPGSDLNKYVKRQKAFKYYTNPHTMIKPTQYQSNLMASLTNPNAFEYLTKDGTKL